MDAKYREAEAELVKAQAALVLAEADLKKVEADLKKEEINLKKAELEQKAEELKALIAEYNARIAAAQAEQAFYEGQKQILEKMLEAALLEAEAAIWDAKKDLYDSQLKYEEALKKAEDAATEANRKELQALRDRISKLSAQYHAAAHALINDEADLARLNALISAVEAGIADLGDIKNAQIEENNKEIARINKILEAVESCQGMTAEEILDASIDVLAELIVQSNVTVEAAKAADAAFDAYYEAIPYNYKEEPLDYEDADEAYITYSFTHDFYVRNDNQHSFQLPNGWVSYDWYYETEDGVYVDGTVKSYLDPETGMFKQVILKEYPYDDIEDEEVLLYQYYDGPFMAGEKFNGLSESVR